MSRNRFTLAVALLGLAPALSFNAQSAENSCVECHQNPDFYAQYPKLHDYYQQWLVSPHNQSSITCNDCHGGNASAASMTGAHSGVLPMNDTSSTLYYQTQPETCGQCHRPKQRQFLQSKHYAALMDHRAAPTCTTCHPAMSRRPELRNIVLNACRNCHSEGNSENLPLIADRAESVFKQLNIAGGLLGWTRIHYESHEWPGDSEERVRELETRYQKIVDKVHQFDLQQTEDSATAILVELRETFDAARRSHEQRTVEDPDNL